MIVLDMRGSQPTDKVRAHGIPRGYEVTTRAKDFFTWQFKPLEDSFRIEFFFHRK